LGLNYTDDSLLVTAAQNPDGTIAVVVLNQGEKSKDINISLGEQSTSVAISGKAIQTIVIPNN
jgi:glucosylceramidase